MNEAIIEELINTTINSFDITFCIVVNIATYIIIKIIDSINISRVLPTYIKRIVMLSVVIILSLVYYFSGSDIKLVINSAILAPVFWSWIGKPIVKKLNIDYNKDDNE